MLSACVSVKSFLFLNRDGVYKLFHPCILIRYTEHVDS